MNKSKNNKNKEKVKTISIIFIIILLLLAFSIRVFFSTNNTIPNEMSIYLMDLSENIETYESNYLDAIRLYSSIPFKDKVITPLYPLILSFLGLFSFVKLFTLIKIFNSILGSIIILLIFLITKTRYNIKTAIIASSFATFCIPMIMFSATALPETLLSLLILLLIYLIQNKNNINAYLFTSILSIVMVSLFYTKAYMIFLFPFILVILFINKFKIKHILIFAILFAILISPWMNYISDTTGIIPSEIMFIPENMFSEEISGVSQELLTRSNDDLNFAKSLVSFKKIPILISFYFKNLGQILFKNIPDMISWPLFILFLLEISKSIVAILKNKIKKAEGKEKVHKIKTNKIKVNKTNNTTFDSSSILIMLFFILYSMIFINDTDRYLVIILPFIIIYSSGVVNLFYFKNKKNEIISRYSFLLVIIMLLILSLANYTHSIDQKSINLDDNIVFISANINNNVVLKEIAHLIYPSGNHERYWGFMFGGESNTWRETGMWLKGNNITNTTISSFHPQISYFSDNKFVAIPYENRNNSEEIYKNFNVSIVIYYEYDTFLNDDMEEFLSFGYKFANNYKIIYTNSDTIVFSRSDYLQ